MLFGASIESSGAQSGTARLTLARTERHWPELYWMLTVLHRHGVKTTLSSGAAGIRAGKLTFRTTAQLLLIGAYRRWYSGGSAAMPDLTLTQPMLVCWLVAGLARSERRPRLTAPAMTRDQARRLIPVVRKLSPAKVSLAGEVVTALRLDNPVELREWLIEAVPEEVWNPQV